MQRYLAGSAVPRTGGAYSTVITAAGLCFVSGQLPLDPETNELVGTTAAEQTRQVLKHLGAALELAGLGLGDLVSVNVMLADIDDWQAMNDAYREVMAPFGFPTRMAVAAGALPRAALVEIQAIAAVPEA